MVYHHQSFVGRDYKAWAQMAPFIIGTYLSDPQRRVLLALSKVNVMYAFIVIGNILLFVFVSKHCSLFFYNQISFFRYSVLPTAFPSVNMMKKTQLVCQEFLQEVKECQPELLQKSKVHMVLHLVECMKEFGPTAAFNTER